MNFFKKRINEQYPPLTVEEDITLRSKNQHEAFMMAKAESVLGRDGILKEVAATVDSDVYICKSLRSEKYAKIIFSNTVTSCMLACLNV